MVESLWIPEEAFRPFLSRESTAIGLSPDRLRASEFVHPFRGVSTASAPGISIAERARDYAPRLLDGQVFSHTTALALRGVPVPDDGKLHLSVLFPRSPPRAVGVRGHSLQRIDPEPVGGLPASAAASAWLESASLVTGEDLVALGDALLPARKREALVDPEELRSVIDRIGVPGLGRARWALPRIRPGVRSRPETHLRLAVVAAGLPEPIVEHPVVVAGGIVLHPDLTFVRQRVGLEYEGDGHRTDRRQWQADIERRELFEAAGMRIIRVTSHDLWIARPALMSRIGTVLLSRSDIRPIDS